MTLRGLGDKEEKAGSRGAEMDSWGWERVGKRQRMWKRRGGRCETSFPM